MNQIKKFYWILLSIFIFNFHKMFSDNIYSDKPKHSTLDSGLQLKNKSRLDILNQYTNEDGTIFRSGKSTITSSTSGGGVNFKNGIYASEEKTQNHSAGNNRENYTLLENKLSGFYDIQQGGKFIIPTGPGSWHVDNDISKLKGHAKFPGGIGLPTLSYNKNILLVQGIIEDQINLNGVHLKLTGDLELRGDQSVGVSGSGALTTIDLNNNRLKIVGKNFFSDTTVAVTFSQPITWMAQDVGLGGYVDPTSDQPKTSGVIELGTRVNLSSSWTFFHFTRGAGQNAYPRTNITIEGNGNILDLTNGSLVLGTEGALTLRNLYLKGFQTSKIDCSTSNYIRLDNVTIELDATATLGSSSNIYIDGPILIVTKNFTFTFSSITANNGNWPIYYDTQGVAANNNIAGGTAVAATQLVTSNSNISNLTTQLGYFDRNSPADLVFSSNITATFDYVLSESHRMVFSGNLTFDGGGHRINLSNKKVPLFVINNNVAVILKNFLIDNFSDSHVSLGSNASLAFGDDCVVNTYPEDTWTTSFNFGVRTTLCGNGSKLTLGSTAGIISTDATGLRIKNILLSGVSGTKISCSSNSSKIIFDNSTLNLSGNYNFTTGFFNIENIVKVNGPYNFSYQSTASSQINSNAELIFEKDSVFEYAPASTSQSLIIFQDKSSKIFFDNTSLSVTTTGLQLTTGTLKVDGQMSIFSTATLVNQAVKFGNNTFAQDLNIDVYPGASINLKTGILSYQNTEI